MNSTMTGSGNGIAAITGSATATGAAGFTFGVIGQSASNSGRGVFGLSTGNGGVGVIGENNNGPGIGVVGKALPGSTGYGVYGSGPIGVFGTGSNYGFQTDSNVQQSRTAGGWVKAMMYVNGTAPHTTSCIVLIPPSPVRQPRHRHVASSSLYLRSEIGRLPSTSKWMTASG